MFFCARQDPFEMNLFTLDMVGSEWDAKMVFLL